MRPFTVLHAPQRSPAWFKARLGRLTGSRAAAMIATTKKGEASASRKDLRTQLVLERLTGDGQEDAWVSPEMRRAVVVEPLAFAAYEALSGCVMQRSGFLAHTTLPVGCSLDGHLDEFAGILEMKCPKSATHLVALQTAAIPPEYLPQIVHNLWVSGAPWCDYLSFDDRFPAHLQTVLVRYARNDVEIALYTKAVALFLDEVADELEAVRALRPAAA